MATQQQQQQRYTRRQNSEDIVMEAERRVRGVVAARWGASRQAIPRFGPFVPPPGSIQDVFRRGLSRRRHIQFNDEERDIQALGEKLGEVNRLTFMAFQSLRQLVTTPTVARMLSASAFLMFPADAQGAISSATFLDFVHLTWAQILYRTELHKSDANFSGYMNRQAMEKFVSEFMHEKNMFDGLHRALVPSYHYHCMAKFLFVFRSKFLDKDRISIRDFLSSGTFTELCLVATDLNFDNRNWFTKSTYAHAYELFQQLDVDGNGLLSRAELIHFQYRGSPITEIVVDRIFEEYVPANDEMQYDQYLDLVLAYSIMRYSLIQDTPNPLPEEIVLPVLRYFWKLLDVEKLGFIDTRTIELFYNDLCKYAREEEYNRDDMDGGLQYQSPDEVVLLLPHAQYVVEELFDIACPGHAHRNRISFQDLVSSNRVSNRAILFLTILIDPTGFRLYEERESGNKNKKDMYFHEDEGMVFGGAPPPPPPPPPPSSSANAQQSEEMMMNQLL